MRPIDAEALSEGIELHRKGTDQECESDRQWAVGYNAGLDRALYSIAYAKTVCLQSSEPLTLEELREMDGEPVWYVFPGADTLTSAGGFFCLCCKGEIIGPSGHSFDCALLDGRFYRRRPEEGKT